MSYNWEEFVNNGDFVSFKEVGDKVVGIIKQIRTAKDFNGNPCPELVLDVDGEEKTVTAGQVLLKAALAEKAPQVGDKIRIVYSGVGDAKPGRAPAKQFTVDVKAGGPVSAAKAAAKTAVAVDDIF